MTNCQLVSLWSPFTVTLCSPVPGCVYRSTWTETSPALPSSDWEVSEKKHESLFSLTCYVFTVVHLTMYVTS